MELMSFQYNRNSISTKNDFVMILMSQVKMFL